jgi:hypothetical protein
MAAGGSTASMGLDGARSTAAVVPHGRCQGSAKLIAGTSSDLHVEDSPDRNSFSGARFGAVPPFEESERHW